MWSLTTGHAGLDDQRQPEPGKVLLIANAAIGCQHDVKPARSALESRLPLLKLDQPLSSVVQTV